MRSFFRFGKQFFRIDDIEDESETRRGQPCAYLVFGVALTLNSANLAYFKALQQVLSLNDCEAIRHFASKHNSVPFYFYYFVCVDECVNLHTGQGMEISLRESGIKPTVQQYYEIIANKTGGLFRLAVLLLSPSAEKVILEVVNEIGIIYQLIDDYRNLFCRAESDADFADDLKEGKFTLATIHGLDSLKKTESLNDRIELVQRLRERGSDAFVLKEIENRLHQLKAKSGHFPEADLITCQLEKLLYCK